MIITADGNKFRLRFREGAVKTLNQQQYNELRSYFDNEK